MKICNLQVFSLVPMKVFICKFCFINLKNVSIRYPSVHQKDSVENPEKREYVVRGGGFMDTSHTCRISNRGRAHFFTHTCELGFRLVFSE